MAAETDKKGAISYPLADPPRLTLLVAALSRSPTVKVNAGKREQAATELVFFPERTTVSGDTAVARYYAKSAGVYGDVDVADAAACAERVDVFVDLAEPSRTEPLAAAELAHLNAYLALRTFLAGHSPSLADAAAFLALRRRGPANVTKARYPHVVRWLAHLDTLPAFADARKTLEAAAAAAAAAAGDGDDKKNKKAGAGESTVSVGAQGKFQELPGAEMGKVVTRFPPEPSGYLHIGHAKAALLNDFYAKQYKGELVFRFDDTNPSKEKEEYVQNIIADLKALDITYREPITHTSDYFAHILDCAVVLMKNNKAYVDDTPMEQAREERGEGIASKRREQPLEENLKMWDEMLRGTPLGKTYVLRAKIDMQHKNKALRDPTFARVVLDPPHHRTGTKFKVYPLYAFACPIVDSIEGVTHAFRSFEYHEQNPLYEWVFDALNIRPVAIAEFSRLNFAYTVLSKRKLNWFVENKYVEGWHSPAFPTVQGILRRGLSVDTARLFVTSQGSSRSANNMYIEKLWALNKQIIDPRIGRYFALCDPVLCVIANAPETTEAVSVPRYRKNPSLGDKIVYRQRRVLVERADAETMKEGDQVTLMEWGNMFVRSIKRDDAGKVVELAGELNPTGLAKETSLKLQWLPESDDNVPLQLDDYGLLVNKPKIEDGDKIEDIANKNLRFTTLAIGEPACRMIQKGESLQLTRKTYYICDSAPVKPSTDDRLMLIQIPDGSNGPFASKATSPVDADAERQKAADKKSAQKEASKKK